MGVGVREQSRNERLSIVWGVVNEGKGQGRRIDGGALRRFGNMKLSVIFVGQKKCSMKRNSSNALCSQLRISSRGGWIYATCVCGDGGDKAKIPAMAAKIGGDD